MKLRDLNTLDRRIERLKAVMKRLRAERRLAILKTQHQKLKNKNGKQSISQH